MDLTTAAHLFAPFIGLMVCTLVHVLFSRTKRTRSRLHGVAVSVVAGFGAVSYTHLTLPTILRV